MSADLYLYALRDPNLVDFLHDWLCGTDDLWIERDAMGDDPSETDVRHWWARLQSREERLSELEKIIDPYGIHGGEHSDSVWIGQVSWIKTAFPLGHAGPADPWKRYVPATVERVRRLTANGPVLTRALAADICAAFSLPNESIYGRPSKRFPYRVGSEGLQKAQIVKRWLHGHLGETIYPTSE